MSNIKNRTAQFHFVAAIGLLVSGAGYASTLWTQALPTANLNGNSSSRSNVAVIAGSPANPTENGSPSTQAIVGDSFTLTGTTNTINTVTIYEIGNIQDGSGPQDTPADEFSAITLYIGPDGGDLTNSFVSSSSVQIQYAGAKDYQSVSSVAFFPIWAITFSGLNLNLASGVYDYAVGATPTNNCGGPCSFALLASDSNPAINGGVLSQESGGFGLFQEDGGPGNPPTITYGYSAPPGFNNPDPNIDVNVLITGSSVPEPGTFAMLALGLAGVVASRRRRS